MFRTSGRSTPVNLIDEVAQYVENPGFSCSVGAWLAGTEYDTAQLREAAAANSAAAVWRFMKARGFNSGQLTVTRHLNGDCKCP